MIDSYAAGHPNTKGLFAVDGGSTQGVAPDDPEARPERQGARAAAMTSPRSPSSCLRRAHIEFTIDQQPYLQGFYPVLQLYMYQVSQKLTGIADVNTGLKFLDKTTVMPYNSTKSRYEGTATGAGSHEVLSHEGAPTTAADLAMAVTAAPEAPPRGPGAAPGPRAARSACGKRFLTLREGSIIVVTLITFDLFRATSADGRFLTVDSLKTLLPFFAPFAILAAGEVFVMINGEIDLSIGAMYLFMPFCSTSCTTRRIAAVPGADPGADRGDGARRCSTGSPSPYVGISSFVATLGMLFALDGADAGHLARHAGHARRARRWSGSTTFSQIFGGGTYSELIWAIGIVIVLQLVLTFTRWGIYTVAVGGNRLGAAEAGVSVPSWC